MNFIGAAERYSSFNLLEPYWDRAFNPAYVQYERFVDVALPSKKIAPLVYMGGMVGYTLAVPVRVFWIGLAVARILWCDGRGLCDRLSEVAQAIAGLFSAIFGVVCPIIAYKIDLKVYGDYQLNPLYHRIWDGLANEVQQAADAIRAQQAAQAQADALRAQQAAEAQPAAAAAQPIEIAAMRSLLAAQLMNPGVRLANSEMEGPAREVLERVFGHDSELVEGVKDQEDYQSLLTAWLLLVIRAELSAGLEAVLRTIKDQRITTRQNTYGQTAQLDADIREINRNYEDCLGHLRVIAGHRQQLIHHLDAVVQDVLDSQSHQPRYPNLHQPIRRAVGYLLTSGIVLDMAGANA